MLVDSHCHLNLCQDIDAIIQRAMVSEVNYMQTVCTKYSDVAEIVDIVNKYTNVFGSVGVHPNEISNSTLLKASELIKLSKQHEKIISLGETGLDYYYSGDKNIVAKQKESLLEHIEAAQESGLPIIIHCREAEADLIEILQSEMRNAVFKGLIHCFTGSREFAYKAIDLGMYISISGIVTFKNSDPLCQIITCLPVQKLLVETDAPYLAPVPFRGRSNEPAFVRFTAEMIAGLQRISLAEVGRITTNNFFTLFNINKDLVDKKLN